MTLLERLKEAAGETQVKVQEPMKHHCTFQTGGPADYFVEVSSWRVLFTVLALLKEEGVPVTVLGKGSNVLVKEGGIRGAVVTLGEGFRQVRRDGNCLVVGAGTPLSQMALAAMEASLSGVAFAGGIPGTFGGAVVMNAGAYGGELKDVLKEVTVLDQKLQVQTLPASALDLGYRHSNIIEKGYLVLEGVLELEEGDKEAIRAQMKDYATRRREKQPLEYASAGSTFKRPEGHFAGALIEQCGLKGYQVGGGAVSTKHAGFVVNLGQAKSDDLLAVIAHVQSVVLEQTGVALECEVKIIGED